MSKDPCDFCNKLISTTVVPNRNEGYFVPDTEVAHFDGVAYDDFSIFTEARCLPLYLCDECLWRLIRKLPAEQVKKHEERWEAVNWIVPPSPNACTCIGVEYGGHDPDCPRFKERQE